jgi:hypothetical protein
LQLLSPQRDLAGSLSLEQYYVYYSALQLFSCLLANSLNKLSQTACLIPAKDVLSHWAARLAGDIDTRLDRTKVKEVLAALRSTIVAFMQPDDAMEEVGLIFDVLR